MLKIYVLVLALLAASQAWADSCSDALTEGNYVSLVGVLRRLNPVLAVPGEDLEQIYLRLKREDESVRGGLLSSNLAEHLRRSQSDKYRMQDLDDAGLLIFYRNSLYALIQRTSNLWRRREVERLAGTRRGSPEERVATHLLDSFFSPHSLDDLSLSSGTAEDYFSQRPWAAYKWLDAMKTISAWLGERGVRSQFEFSKWVSENQTRFNISDWGEINRLLMALVSDRRLGECCHSQAACVRCPFNRLWLKGL